MCTGHSIGVETTRERLTRRALLGRGLRLFAVGAAAALVGGSAPHLAFGAPVQGDWRRCSKCNQLFFDGYADKGRCSAGGGHAAGPREYLLTYDDSTGPGQGDWRYCSRCKTLFFNGYSAKGVCPRDGGSHLAAGYNFFLPHDRRAGTHEEESWRYCGQCQALYFSAAAPSACPKGGTHVAAGYLFVLALAGGRID
jgi:hypothetical protein